MFNWKKNGDLMFDWQRVKDLRELKIGDIIRMNPDCKCKNHMGYLVSEISRIELNEDPRCFNTICTKQTVKVEKYKIYYNKPFDIEVECLRLYEADLSSPLAIFDFCLEKLIDSTEEMNIKEDIEVYKDEIDLLLDCVER